MRLVRRPLNGDTGIGKGSKLSSHFGREVSSGRGQEASNVRLAEVALVEWLEPPVAHTTERYVD